MVSAVILNNVILNAVMLNVIMLSVVMLSAVVQTVRLFLNHSIADTVPIEVQSPSYVEMGYLGFLFT